MPPSVQGELARRIRGIKEAFCRDGIGDGDIGDAGLDAGRAVAHVDGEHFGHARDAEHDRVFERQRSTAERRAGATRDDLELSIVAEAEHPAYFLGACGQHHGKRDAAIGGERVSLEGSASFAVDDQAGRGD